MLALCLMKSESKHHFKFALDSYIKVGYRIPRKVFVDQHAGPALVEYWENNFEVEIVFCIMHIHRNINENIGN